MKRVWCTNLKTYFNAIAVLAIVFVTSGFGQLLQPAQKAYAAGPTSPPVTVCGNSSLLDGPSTAPNGAVVVPAGDNSSMVPNYASNGFTQANKTFWFAPGVHTLGDKNAQGAEYDQIQPGANATYIGAPGAIIDGQGTNRTAFGTQTTGVTIQYLTIRNFVAYLDQGTVNHDSGANWTISHNTITLNGGAGVFAGSGNTLAYNCLKDNSQYGFQVFNSDPNGPQNVTLDHNEIVGNNTGNWEAVNNGCGCTGGGKFWDAHTVDITNNYVHNNLSVGLWADTNNSDFLLENNYIADNDSQGFFYEISYNAIVRNNTFVRNGLVGGPTNPGFPTGAIYLSEAGGDSRIPGRTAQIEIYGNTFTNNYSGVILWENADRFCNSPNNTSTGYCTDVNPSVNLSTCSSGTINNAPNYNDCRWKTQNVKVHDNAFNMDRSTITNCTNSTGCGYQGIFSNSGSSPSWSPYMGQVIRDAITYNQNNTFSNNTYTGTWAYMPYDQSSQKTFAQWQASPYSQDAGSTYNATPSPVNASITSFTANPTTINSGSSSMLSWTVAAGANCTIDHSIGSVANSGSQSVSPTTTTTYTLSCNGLNGGTGATSTATITVNSAPTPVNASITSFTANPTTINSGSSSTLSWTVATGTGCTIDQGVGAVSNSGTQSVSPTTTKTYTLTCNGLNGGTSATATATITVNSAPTPVNASITSFTASSTTIIAGQSSNLTWAVGAGTSCTIDHNIGAVATNGTQSVSPTATTTYTLSCNGLNGGTGATAQATVTVAASTDTDHDGIADQIENAGPNNGDANYDGTPDNQQANVASILNAKTGDYNTLTSTNNCSFSNVASNITSHSNAMLGAWSFHLGCASTTVTILLDKTYDHSKWQVAKQDSGFTTTLDISPRTTVTEKVLGASTVTAVSYPVTDGGDLDEDGTANGTIVDPVTVLAGTSGGSLAYTGQNENLVIIAGITVLTLGLAAASWKFVRR